MTSIADGFEVTSLSLGARSAPIDVAVAFGSVWVANHHRDVVTRIDPETMVVVATIKVGSGPGWFVRTDDAMWVSNQNGVGISRIDPATNVSGVETGDWAPCGKAIVAAGRIWQPACDAHRFMAIDPATHLTADVDAAAQWSLVLAGSQVISGGPNGLARFDPEHGSFTPSGGADPGRLIGYDGVTIWSSDERRVLRIRPADGSVLATLPIADAGAVAFDGGHAWATSSAGLVEVDPISNSVVRTLQVGPSVAVVAGAGALWITSFDANTVTRVRPAP